MAAVGLKGCKRKFCCKNGKCEYQGKKVCSKQSVKMITEQKKKKNVYSNMKLQKIQNKFVQKEFVVLEEIA